ncbi:unnamed protein product [Calicophoron daubneyi]|uniref:Ig-like domain-containing protein n=1 Tax=Calicophoron daubneyi TaxID=300641 RepID=A0AAV2TER8_CALDB
MLFVFAIVAFSCALCGLADLQIEAEDSVHRVTGSKKVDVTYNRQITLRCYSSEKNESIYWEYSGSTTDPFRLLEPSKEIQIYELSVSEVLVDIAMARQKMGGRYRCTQGNRTRTVTLNVSPEPVAINGRFAMMEKVEVIENVRVVFYYPQKKMGGPMSCTYFVPDSLVESVWFKWDGGMLATNQDYYKPALEKGGGPGGRYVKGYLSIVKEDPPESMFTEYTCTLCAKGICTEDFLSVTTGSYAYVAEPKKYFSFNDGDKVTLTAKVEGSTLEQPTSLTWTRNGEEIKMNTKGKLYVHSGKMSKRAHYGTKTYEHDQLIFDSVKAKDAAVYSYTYDFQGIKAVGALVVNVKGPKETPAWIIPLIATVVEVILVVLIITVSTFYGKRKARNSRAKNQDNHSSAHGRINYHD